MGGPTSGEWKVDWDVNPNAVVVERASDGAYLVVADCRRAEDARFIANAQDLLEAAIGVLECGCEMAEGSGMCGICYGILSRAIAKAQG